MREPTEAEAKIINESMPAAIIGLIAMVIHAFIIIGKFIIPFIKAAPNEALVYPLSLPQSLGMVGLTIIILICWLKVRKARKILDSIIDSK